MKIYLLIITFFIYSSSGYTAFPSKKVMKNDLDDVITDVCNKKIVLLGEDSAHGSGTTMEIKTELVKRLIDECSFSAVFFESPIYEFLNFERSLSLKLSTEQQLAQSIGGLWSTAKPMNLLISYLHQKAVIGKVSLAGIDAQGNAANQPFSQKKLPSIFTKYLEGERRKECETELYRNLNWEYDDKHPYKAETEKRIISCITEIKKNVDSQNLASKSFLEEKFMVNNFADYKAFSSGDYFNLRDKAMAENILWHTSRLPTDTKIIVWCATVHAAKKSVTSTTKIPMGQYIHQALNGQVASIGFSALSGSFGRSESKLKKIKQADLEKNTLSKASNNIKYLNVKALDELGVIKAHPIHYNNIKPANWSEILDGIIVLQNETPLEYIR